MSDVAGLVVLVLATAVAVCLVISVADLALTSRPIANVTEVSDLLSTVFGASIGVIATFIGLRARPPKE
jgi:hypothetical protein